MSTVGNDRDTYSAGREPGTSPSGREGTAGGTTERLASRAHEAIDKAAATAGQAEQRVRETATRAAEKARRSEQQLEETMSESVDRVKSYIERNPVASAGLAFVAGVILSTLLRR